MTPEASSAAVWTLPLSPRQADRDAKFDTVWIFVQTKATRLHSSGKDIYGCSDSSVFLPQASHLTLFSSCLVDKSFFFFNYWWKLRSITTDCGIKFTAGDLLCLYRSMCTVLFHLCNKYEPLNRLPVSFHNLIYWYIMVVFFSFTYFFLTFSPTNK